MTAPKHPAVYSESLLPVFRQLLDEYSPGTRVLDPFAGVGTIHRLQDAGYITVGVELEPEWANQSPGTIIGDATRLPFRPECFHAVVTSPVFGNRFSDCHNARDGSYRRTYTHVLGRKLTENNAGAMQWGDKYRNLHVKAWAEVYRVLEPEGLFILDIKDHIRNGDRQHVDAWHYRTILGLGFTLLTIRRVDVPHFRFGANRDRRLPERVLAFRKVGR